MGGHAPVVGDSAVGMGLGKERVQDQRARERLRGLRVPRQTDGRLPQILQHRCLHRVAAELTRVARRLATRVVAAAPPSRIEQRSGGSEAGVGGPYRQAAARQGCSAP